MSTCLTIKPAEYNLQSRIPQINTVKDSFGIRSSKIHRLPPILPTSDNIQKRLSKIPVVTGRHFLVPLPNACNLAASESGLNAAAARRQKYHLSRYPAIITQKQDYHTAEPSKSCSSNNILPYHRFLPALAPAAYNFQVEETASSGKNLKTESACNKVSSETVLPCNGNYQNGKLFSLVNTECQSNSSAVFTKPIDSHFGRKKKGLLGEFTHFPTVCNIVPIKSIKHCKTGLSPALPKIIPKCVPVAPPPSVSSSLEQEEATRERKMQTLRTNHITKEEVDRSLSLQLQAQFPVFEKNKHLFHGISIVIEPADVEIDETMCNNEESNSPSYDIVKTIMELAQLRREAFVRLLEEYYEILQKIKRAEINKT